MMDIDTLMKLPESNPKRKQAAQVVTRFTAIVRGFFTRTRFKRFKLIALIEGKKAHEIDMWSIYQIPRSTIKEVVAREIEMGSLKLDTDMKEMIKRGREVIGLSFENGRELRDGQIYSGQWNAAKGCKEGFGTQVWPDGSVYEGFWNDDKAFGFGRIIIADGDVYEGEWMDDMAHGIGSYFYAEGATYHGQWNQDKQEGRGRSEWTDGSFYDGTYQNGKRHGQGQFQWADGSNYNGEWRDNKMHGTGEFRWADGRVYSGNYANDKKHGQGVYSWPDGRRYQGQFHEGRQHGKGIYWQSNGKEIYGLWNLGKKVQVFSNEQDFLNDQPVDFNASQRSSLNESSVLR